MNTKILITGGCGFIGSNFLNIMVQKYRNSKFLNIDKLTYAGKVENTAKINKFKNYKFYKLDICDYSYVLHLGEVIAEGESDKIIGNKDARKLYLGDSFKV